MSETGTNSFDSPDLVVAAPHRVFVSGWTAYVRPVFFFLLFLAIGYLMASVYWIAGTAWMFLALALFLYNFLVIHSIRLYTDDEGVWVFAGIFPWNKGVRGVKWRDLDEATFLQNFTSWAFGTYTVRVAHRYTKASEIQLAHIRDGDEAVMHINRMHLERIKHDQAEDEPADEPSA